MAKPTLTDFIEILDGFNKNIEYRLLEGHINKVWTLDMINVLPNAFVSAISALSLNDTNKPQLIAFYNTYIKAAWVHYAYARFLRSHGKNITQFGIQYITDQDASNVGNDEVAYMVKGFEGDALKYLNIAKEEAKKENYTFDNVNLFGNDNKETSTKPRFRISGI